MRGRFVVLEGLDGSGISTQVEMLRLWCERNDISVSVTKEPSDGPVGSQLKMALGHRVTYSPDVMALLFAADRLDHLDNDVRPKLADGITVVSDRYYLSSFAYQSESIEMGWLRELNSRCPKPDVTLFLDVPLEACLERWNSDVYRSQDRLQLYEEEDILRRVRGRFLEMIGTLGSEGERIEVIDGSHTIQEVNRRVVSVVEPMLTSGRSPSDATGTASPASQEVESILGLPPTSRT